jgi:peptidoglycan/xylan/chitin deacetylase (PgdA/CDA1 family)
MMAHLLIPLFAAVMSASPVASRPADVVPESVAAKCTFDHGGIIRGPRDRKCMALIFTGGDYGEGTESILDDLASRGIKASFFVTGDYIKKPEHRRLLRRMIADGHYVGPHSDAHLLYCPWDDRPRTLVTEAQFRADLEKNIADLVALGASRERMRFFVPPYEWYNDQIVDWAARMGLVVVSFTPGTRSNADYLADKHPRFIASEQIYRGILEFEARPPDGLNGFLLLLHVGVGPERTDKMHRYVGRLADDLRRRDYRLVRVDELLGMRPVTSRPAAAAPSGQPN